MNTNNEWSAKDEAYCQGYTDGALGRERQDLVAQNSMIQDEQETYDRAYNEACKNNP